VHQPDLSFRGFLRVVDEQNCEGPKTFLVPCTGPALPFVLEEETLIGADDASGRLCSELRRDGIGWQEAELLRTALRMLMSGNCLDALARALDHPDVVEVILSSTGSKPEISEATV